MLLSIRTTGEISAVEGCQQLSLPSKRSTITDTIAVRIPIVDPFTKTGRVHNITVRGRGEEMIATIQTAVALQLLLIPLQRGAPALDQEVPVLELMEEPGEEIKNQNNLS